MHPQNIALFIDGTWDKPSRTKPTNVYKLFLASQGQTVGKAQQLTYYLPGVGHDIRQYRVGAAVGRYGSEWGGPVEPEVPLWSRNRVGRRTVGGLFGAGTAARIKEAYAFLCEHFNRNRGDRIFVFGFSRGAMAARSLAGFVFRVGTLLQHRADLVEAAYAVYESGTDPNDTLLANFLQSAADIQMLQVGDDRAALPLHFVGLWDTVSGMNLPWQGGMFKADRTVHHQRMPPLNVLAARHALALHELRADFEPELWAGGGHCNLQQVWFAGAHKDVGGGCTLNESGLSNIALRWMADEAKSFNLQLNSDVLKQFTGSGDEVRHNSISGLFRGFSPTPRDALLTMRTPPASPTDPVIGPLHFHRSVLRHIAEHAIQVGQKWPSKVGTEMDKIDRRATIAYVTNKLMGDLAVGHAGPASTAANTHA